MRLNLLDIVRPFWPQIRDYERHTTRGGDWRTGAPVGVIVHHTAPPVPYPLANLAGLTSGNVKCNLNIKTDGTVYAVCGGRPNYANGAGSGVVLAETRAGKAPTGPARARNLTDDTNGNLWYVAIEVDHPGDGSPLPVVQEMALVATLAALCTRLGFPPEAVIGHLEWTRRKIDPFWNGSPYTMPTLRNEVRAALAPTAPINPGGPPMANHPPKDLGEFVAGHRLGRPEEWMKGPWEEYRAAGGSSVPDSLTWPAVRADLGFFYSRFVRPLARRLDELERRVDVISAGAAGTLPDRETVEVLGSIDLIRRR
jgi:hypothetical protein